MNPEPYITGDWGTSRLRLSLCRGERVLDTREGPGIGALRAPAGEVVRSLTADWRVSHGPVPLVLCGMAGSRNGWRETPYMPCPTDPRALGGSALRFEADGAPVAIIPGLQCASRPGSPELMRGEETQIAGAMLTQPRLAGGRHLLCLPGTHSKWVWLEDGRVCDFLTALTGEMFSLLRDSSSLTRVARPVGADDARGAAADCEEGFAQGLQVTAGPGGASLLHALFGVRSRQLVEGRPREWALSYLSGLLIGADVRGAIPLFAAREEAVLIGDAALTELYARAFRREGIAASCLDGDACALAGLRSLWRA